MKMKTDQKQTNRRDFLKAGALATGSALLAPMLAQASENLDEVQMLFVQSAQDVSVKKDRLVLIGVSPATLFFSDRPKRVAGHMTTQAFVDEWVQGKSKESFHNIPPNAVLSVFGDDEIVDMVVVLKNPRLAGSGLIYDIDELDKEEKIPSGMASLFIDPIGMPMSPTSVAGVHRRERRRVIRHNVIR